MDVQEKVKPLSDAGILTAAIPLDLLVNGLGKLTDSEIAGRVVETIRDLCRDRDRLQWLEDCGLPIKWEWGAGKGKFYSARYPQYRNQRYPTLRAAIDAERDRTGEP